MLKEVDEAVEERPEEDEAQAALLHLLGEEGEEAGRCDGGDVCLGLEKGVKRG